jgi:hypothetical protein
MYLVYYRSLALCLLFAFFAGSTCARSATLTFTPDSEAKPSSVTCEVSVEKIGNVTLNGGTASIQGDKIEIKAIAGEYLPVQSILNGFVLKLEADTAAKPPEITGLAYFQSGELLRTFDDPQVADLIFKHDGAVTGRIIRTSGYDMQIVRPDGRGEQIDVSTVKFIRSPRAFVFRIPLTSRVPLLEASPFKAEAAVASFRNSAPQRSLPFSSVIPNRQNSGAGTFNTTGDGKLSRFGEGSTNPLEPQPPEAEDDQPIGPVFKWQKPGIAPVQ